jgi:hypothetical protein
MQLTMPMVHPTNGEIISSYTQLMNDPNTAKIWKTASWKDFGGMAKGDKKTGQKWKNPFLSWLTRRSGAAKIDFPVKSILNK